MRELAPQKAKTKEVIQKVIYQTGVKKVVTHK